MSRVKHTPLFNHSRDILASMEDIDDVMVRFEKLRHTPRGLSDDATHKSARTKTRYHRQRCY